MNYKNPIILSDYSDPDVIRVNDNYYMIASSFNHTPGVPILKSKNLVEWKLIGYILDKLPHKFDNVRHGEGVWAPSLRYYNNKFYALIPFPDEGIYVTSTSDIENGKWEEPWPILEGKGYEDPCPIWINDKCYVVIGFVKSRIGFNSLLAIFETTPDFKKRLTDYKIIFDGHNTQPTIEGPKFYERNGYIYILAPAGSVKTGWQTALRSKNIYGPYEEKIILMQGGTKINGPHQGALVDDYFIHFQDMGVYGRIVHLQPVKWVNDWPIIGETNDYLLPGNPVLEGTYPVNIKTNYKIQSSDKFKGNKLSLIWQTPSNMNDSWYKVSNGLILNCINDEISKNKLNLCKNLFLTKIVALNFNISVKIDVNNLSNDSEAGLCFMGEEYAFISIKKINNINHLLITKGKFNEIDEIIYDEIIDINELKLSMYFKYPGIYKFGYNGKIINLKFNAKPGRWIGGKYGLFARGIAGYAIFNDFKMVNKDE